MTPLARPYHQFRGSHKPRAPRSVDQKPTDSALDWENPELRV